MPAVFMVTRTLIKLDSVRKLYYSHTKSAHLVKTYLPISACFLCSYIHHLVQGTWHQVRKVSVHTWRYCTHSHSSSNLQSINQSWSRQARILPIQGLSKDSKSQSGAYLLADVEIISFSCSSCLQRV